ncbi:transcript variant X2 [Nothobranchius furzeri]|uniref:Large ribosomal subunit protein bL17m n=1 Tax=Nothobranchius furzeri TaxID=105023 RepID=A0A9D2XB20_NOTFU|nr:transcript variant X2 [Nothobranchius furzeri]
MFCGTQAKKKKKRKKSLLIIYPWRSLTKQHFLIINPLRLKVICSFCLYLPQLIDYAKKGDTDEKAMKMASFWLTEKDLVPKLFKVLAPRFETQSNGYTRMARIPNRENLDKAKMAVLEYKGNPFPPLYPAKKENELTLINQLLRGYREERARR